MIKYNIFEPYNEIAHFCTSREGGVSVGNYASWNLSPFSGDNANHIAENQRILCNQLGIGIENLIIPQQTHETVIREINDTFLRLPNNEKTSYLYGVDAMMTDLKRVCIGITTADCVPLLFFDPRLKVIAAAHAGWRGTCGRIAEKTIKTMAERYGCNPSDIRATIGPSISSSVYEVGNDVVTNFENAGFDIEKIFEKRNDSIFLDLWTANQQSLENAGILPENIEIAGLCTYTEQERFFSARRLGLKSGRMLSGIMLQ